MSERKVVVTGLGLIAPVGLDVASGWENLLAGKSGIQPITRFDLEPFSVRSALMAEHATSGIRFAGRVSQLITASTGFDEWEWGVTLWARAPEHIKEIVYSMRFDRASAKYAEFGEFYIGYLMPPAEAIRHLRL